MSGQGNKDRRPWPMTWVAVAIAVFITLYTVINFQFRKNEDPHLPYEEAKERESRFFEFDLNGWKRLEVVLYVPLASDPSAELLPVEARAQEGRLDQDMPMDLVTVIPRRPDLAGGVQGVETSITEDLDLKILLISGQGEIGAVQLEAYLKDGHLVILAVESEQTGGLEGSTTFRLSLSGAGIPGGLYSVTMYTEEAVYEWKLTVD